jgi:hypothetical protein
MDNMRKLIKTFKKIVIISILLLMLAIASFGALLVSAPLQITPFKAVLSEYLAHKIGADSLKMSSPTLFINAKNGSLECELNDVEAKLSNAQITAKTIRLALSLSSLLKLQPAYTGLQMRHFHLLLPSTKTDLLVPELALRPNENDNAKNHLEITMRSGDKEAGKIIADIFFNKKTIVINSLINNVPASLLHMVTTEIGEVEANMNVALELVFERDFTLIFAHPKIEIAQMKLYHPVFYPNGLKLQNIFADMQWEKRKRFLQVNELKLQHQAMEFAGYGKLLPDFSVVKVGGNFTKMQIQQLIDLWPETIGNEPKTWVKEHLLAGIINEANINIKHRKTTKANIVIRVQDAKVKYAPHLPVVKNARGEVTITDNSLKLNIDSAESLDTITVKNAVAEIPSFSEASVPMIFTLPIKAQAKDIALFLSKKYLNKGGELQLNPAQINGEIDGVLTLNFPLYPERAGLGNSSFDNLLFTINAKINDFSQNNLFGKWNLQNFTGNINMDIKQVAVEAAGALQGIDTQLIIKHLFAEKVTDYDFKLQMEANNLPRLSINLPDGLLNGALKINGKMHEDDTMSNIEAEIDLSNAEMDLSTYGWRKKTGKHAILKLIKQTKDGQKNIKSLHFTSADEELQGSVALDDNDNIQLLKLDIVKLSHADLILEYLVADANGRSHLSLQGKKLDIGWLQPDKESVSTNNTEPHPTNAPSQHKQNPLNHLMNKVINVDIQQIVTKQQTLHDFTLHSDCNADFCDKAQLSAMDGKNNQIMANIGVQTDGKRHFMLQLQDFGSSIKATANNDNFKGGIFSLKGIFADNLSNKPLQGKMILQNVKVVNAPILTRIFTLVSLTGIADALAGDGISFDKIIADIDYDGERILFDKATAKGDALGVMFAGMIQPFGLQKLNLKGTIIPSYSLNSLPSQIPLLGELLIGDEGEGVFATRFSVKGTLDDPDVSANPLSMITPGFLRNVFEIFPEAQPDAQNKQSPSNN